MDLQGNKPSPLPINSSLRQTIFVKSGVNIQGA